MMQVSIMALATTSSVVTFPTALKTIEGNLGVSNRIAKFIIPFGSSISRNGAAMYMAITVVTIAQIYNITYSNQEYLFIAVLAMLVSLAIVIPQMNLPVEIILFFA